MKIQYLSNTTPVNRATHFGSGRIAAHEIGTKKIAGTTFNFGATQHADLIARIPHGESAAELEALTKMFSKLSATNTNWNIRLDGRDLVVTINKGATALKSAIPNS